MLKPGDIAYKNGATFKIESIREFRKSDGWNDDITHAIGVMIKDSEPPFPKSYLDSGRRWTFQYKTGSKYYSE